MHKIILECETITPMLSSGANREQLEIRPSEFKASMRWFWRALNSNISIEELRDHENEIFGGTKTGKSKIKLIVKGSQVRTKYAHEIRKSNKLGLRYIFFPLFRNRLNRNTIKYIDIGNKFIIELSSLDNDYFNLACKLLWLSIYLSGIGARARRGAGNITVNVVKGDAPINFICEAQNINELIGFYKENLARTRDLIIDESRTFNPKFTSLKDSKIYVFDKFDENNWEEALNFLAELYMNYRKKITGYLDKAAFGLPVIYSTKKRIVPGEIQGSRLKSYNRLASTLFFKIVKSKKSLFFPILVKFSFSGLEKIKVITDDSKITIDCSSMDKKIQNFIKDITNDMISMAKDVEEIDIWSIMTKN